MKLIIKFNLILGLFTAAGLAVAGYVSYKLLEEHADQEVIEHARMMMESAVAVRTYTINELRPLLQQLDTEEFLPQTVPSYAATQNFLSLQKDNPEYAYKEAVLNPTNPRDKATDWESDIIMSFRKSSQLKEVVGERDTPLGRSLYLAWPIKITNEACLACHSTVDKAPESMVKLYGTANGFGWQHNEVVGSRIINVPVEVAQEKARKAFTTFMVLLVSIFVGLAILINVMLHTLVTTKINAIAATADRVSKGEQDVPEFDAAGSAEMTSLAKSFNRMRVSLDKAMKMLGD